MAGNDQVRALHQNAQEEFEDAKAAMRLISLRLNENMAFYAGKHYGIPSFAGWLTQVSMPDQAAEVYNYIWPTVRSWVASMMRSKPSLVAVAPSDSSTDITIARATNRLLKSLERGVYCEHEELAYGEMLTGVHGAAMWKVYWDPTAGRQQKTPKMQQTPFGEMPDTDIVGSQRMYNVAVGQPKLEAFSVIDAIPDPSAIKRGDIRHVFHRKRPPMSKAMELFPVDAYGVSTAGRWDTGGGEDFDTIQRDAIENETRLFGRTPNRGKGARGNEPVRIVEGWYAPTDEFPGGLVIIFSGDMLLAISALPYEWPWILRQGPGRRSSLFPDGIVSPLIPMQRTININASKKREWIDYILSPPMLVPEESNIRKEHMSDVAGYLLYYNHLVGTPKWMDVPSIPNEMFNVEASLVQMMKDISSISDLDRGGVPEGLSTARAMAYLYEFQQGVQETDTKQFQLDYRLAMRKQLKLIADFMPDQELLTILGFNNEWEAVALKKKEINFNAEIMLENDPQPNSKALQVANAKEAFQIGALEDTPGAIRYRKLANMYFVDKSETDAEEVHTRRALKEWVEFVEWVNAMQQGAGMMQMQPPLRWLEQDRHDIHAQCHADHGVTDEYLRLPMWAQQMWDDHRHQHEQAYLEQVQMQGMQTQALGETNAGPPPPKQGQAESPADGGQSDTDALNRTAQATGDTRAQQKDVDNAARVAEPQAA